MKNKINFKADCVELWIKEKQNKNLSFKELNTLKLLIKQSIKPLDKKELLQYLDVPTYLYEDLF